MAELKSLYESLGFADVETYVQSGNVVSESKEQDAEKEIFLFCPGGYGKTKLSNTFFEKKLGVVATTRNWKTVNTLYEMARKR